MNYSDFIVYVDESGDHRLDKINQEYPVFVLAFCIFKKSDYADVVVPRLQKFKFQWFGHDAVILHEHEIRKQKPPFQFLTNKMRRDRFMNELSSALNEAPMEIIASVIRKENLKRRYKYPNNPYHLALLFCLERLDDFLRDQDQQDKLTHIIFEQRGGRSGGGKEDKLLELEFRRIMDGVHELSSKKYPNFDLRIVPKKSNSSGLQIADLVARPIGLKSFKGDQVNRAYDIIDPKIWTNREQTFGKTGLKKFP